MTTGILEAFGILIPMFYILFWVLGRVFTGPYPPLGGWSKNQLRRMDEGKSPWRWWEIPR